MWLGVACLFLSLHQSGPCLSRHVVPLQDMSVFVVVSGCSAILIAWLQRHTSCAQCQSRSLGLEHGSGRSLVVAAALGLHGIDTLHSLSGMAAAPSVSHSKSW